MTDLIFYFLAAISSILASLYLWRSRQWTDNDYYALVQKYSDAASALTAMKAELDKLQEQLEFSEDVRYTLGMENARLADRIKELERDLDRSESVRLMLTDQLDFEISGRFRLAEQVESLQRSLAIARHKEFKRWRKSVKFWCRWPDDPFKPSPADEFNTIEYVMHHKYGSSMKDVIRGCLTRLKTMDPYPLP